MIVSENRKMMDNNEYKEWVIMTIIKLTYGGYVSQPELFYTRLFHANHKIMLYKVL